MRKATRERFSSFLSLSLILLSLLSLVAVSKPVWAERGARFDYEGHVREILFYFSDPGLIPQALLSTPGAKVLGAPGAEVLPGSNSAMVRVLFEEEVPARISLVLREVEGSAGIFQVALEVGRWSSTLSLRVDLATRDVYLANGTYLGKTVFWIPPCRVGERFPYAGQGNSTVFATASSVWSMNTPQGVQDALLVWTEHTRASIGGKVITPVEAQSPKHFTPRGNFYDADTFVLLEGNIDQDAFLSAFGIASFFTFQIRLVYTNVDLGPQNLVYILFGVLLTLAILAAIAGTVVYYLRFKRRKAWGSR